MGFLSHTPKTRRAVGEGTSPYLIHSIIFTDSRTIRPLFVVSQLLRWLSSQQTFVLMKTSFVFVFKRRLQDVLIKTNIFVFAICLQDVLKTFSRYLAKESLRHLQDVLQKMSLQDLFKTYHQIKLFFLTRLREVFNTFLRRTAKTIICRGICLGHTSEKFMISVQNLQGR